MKFYKLLNKLYKNNLLLFLVMVTLIHIIVIDIYFQHEEETLQINNQKNLNHSMLTLIISASKNMKRKEFLELINKLSSLDIKINTLKVSIDINPFPKADLKYMKNTSSNNIIEKIPKNTKFIQISYQLENNLWLNYQEYSVNNSYKLAVITVLLELILICLIFFYNFSLQRFRIILRNFKNSAERLGINNKVRPIRVYGTRLIRETTSAMHSMQERIQNLINNRTKTLAAISHDLRTPITRLKLRIHLIENRVDVKKMIDDLYEIESMICDILTFAKEDFSHPKKIMFDLNSLIGCICDDFFDQGYLIDTRLPKERIACLGTPLTLKRTFNNIIQNAFKYASEVFLTLKHTKTKVYIIIDDNGPGIPEKELHNAFQSYHRCSNNSIYERNGTGLGLSIAQEVIHAHNGTIQLFNIGKKLGLRVQIELPIFENFKI